jgi:hypothetical protein
MGTAQYKSEAIPFELTFSPHFIKNCTGKAYCPVNREIKSLVSSSSPVMDYPAPIQN